MTVPPLLARCSLAGFIGCFLGSDPLGNGMHRGDAAILLALVLAPAGSIPLFRRRDLPIGVADVPSDSVG